MATAIEYAVLAHIHEQNGGGSGPLPQHGPGGGAAVAGSVAQLDVVPAAPAEGWLVTGLPAVLLAAVAVALWRRRLGSRTRDKSRS
ncbi:hypothetical protein [Amycolatopsis sp. lyj-23]|uniref:hypothetical protein n=1 Tax=Amycolatopsis sp. lyj-23 TaxID=2789283 RepID=UPI0039787CC1